MRRFLLLVLAVCCLGVLQLSAQQEPMFTHYMFNKLVYNPAYAGSRDAICATLVYHNQWGNMVGPDKEGAPVTMNFSIHGPLTLGKKTDLGVGFHVIDDKSGFIGTTGFLASGAYKRKLSFAELGLGLNAGMVQQTIGAEWRAEHPADKRLPNKSSSMVFDAGIGAYLNALNWYAGISAMHLTQSKAQWEAQGGGTVDYPITATYYATAGYNLQLASVPNFEFQPSAIVKTDFAKTVADFSLLALYKQRFWGGFNLRTERITAGSVMLGAYVFDNLAVGYSYDIFGIKAFGGTHELMANYCFKLTPIYEPPVWHKSPRFL